MAAPRRAASIPALRLCGHGQDHAGAACGGRRRGRRRVRGLHRQGCSRHARPRLPGRLDHSLHDLSFARVDEGGPSFVLNRSSVASKAALIVIDECSMVDEDLGRDLLSFGKPVLVLGDPAQLPPVKGGGFFTAELPDAMLTEVHRQARDNPIIRLSMAVREGQPLPLGAYGESRVIRRRDIDADAVMRADQVLVGLNRTRRLYNGRIRELSGYRNPMPGEGEKLVCLRNDKTKGLLNGGAWTVRTVRPPREDFVRLEVAPEEESRRRPVEVAVLRAFFEGGRTTFR